MLKGHKNVSSEPAFLQDEQLQLSQPFLREAVFQSSDHSCGLPPDSFQQVHVLLVLKIPELDAMSCDGRDSIHLEIKGLERCGKSDCQ